MNCGLKGVNEIIGVARMSSPPLVLTAACQVLCQLLQEAGNVALVNIFLSYLFSRLVEKHAIAVDIARLVSAFLWAVVGKALLPALIVNERWVKGRTCTVDYYAKTTALAVARALSRGKAQEGLLSLAVEQARNLSDKELTSSTSIAELWSLVLIHGNDRIVHNLSCKFKQMNPRLLVRVIKCFARYLGDNDFPQERKAVLVAIMSCRFEWLKNQARVLENPFSWEMPAAEFPNCAEIEVFLRRSETTMSTTGVVTFRHVWDARDYVQRYAAVSPWQEQCNASFDMKATKADLSR